MDKYSIKNLPRYYEPYSHDCLQNCIAGFLISKNIDPDLVLADYLSFVFDAENGFIGVNYPMRFYTSFSFPEEILNTSLHLCYLPATIQFDNTKQIENCFSINEKKINIIMINCDDEKTAYRVLKERLSNGIPVIAAVDLYYLNYNKFYYNKIHRLHNVVIYGIDEAKGIYEICDIFKSANSNYDGAFPIENLNLARNSDHPVADNPFTGVHSKPIRNQWADIVIGREFAITDNLLMEIIQKSCGRMHYECDLLGCKTGIAALKEFRDYLMRLQQKPFDGKLEYLLKSYYREQFKLISRNRNRFNVFLKKTGHLLPAKSYLKVSGLLNESAKYWDICGNYIYKIAAARQSKQIEELNPLFGKIIEWESGITGEMNTMLDECYNIPVCQKNNFTVRSQLC